MSEKTLYVHAIRDDGMYFVGPKPEKGEPARGRWMKPRRWFMRYKLRRIWRG